MSLPDHYVTVAKQRFLATHPAVREELNSINQRHSDCMGVDVKALRDYHLDLAMDKDAAANNLDIFEYRIRLGLDDPADRNRYRVAHHQEFADALGLDWPDYIQLNWLHLE